MKNKVQIQYLDQRLTMPEYQVQYATQGAAAIDLRAAINEPIRIYPNQNVLIGTGLAIYLQDPALCGYVYARSGLGRSKNGLVLSNGVGVIDSDYQGEIMVSLLNTNPTYVWTIEPLERFAQYVIAPVIRPEFEVVASFEKSERGSGGFGSTGSK